MLKYLFSASKRALRVIIELSSYHENFQDCLFHILAVQDNKDYATFQQELFLNLVVHYEKGPSKCPLNLTKVDFSYLLVKILSERNYYLRYLSRGQANFETLSKALKSRIFIKPISETQQPIRRNSSKSLSDSFVAEQEESLLNQDALVSITLLTKNLILDLATTKEEIKSNKLCMDSKLTAPDNEDNQVLEILPCPRDREIVLRPDDLESEEDEEDNTKQEFGQKSQFEIYKFKNLIQAWGQLTNHFSKLLVEKKEKFGLTNLKMIEFIDLVLVLIININYLIKKKESHEASESNALNMLFPFGVENELILLEALMVTPKHFFDNLIDCICEYELHNILHWHIENIIQSVCSQYSPIGIGSSLVSSNFIDRLLSVTKLNDEPAQLSIACEIATNIFMSSNSEIQSSIEQSKINF